MGLEIDPVWCASLDSQHPPGTILGTEILLGCFTMITECLNTPWIMGPQHLALAFHLPTEQILLGQG